MCPASNAWQQVQHLEDVMSHIASIETAAQTVRIQAWKHGSYETILTEAGRILAENRNLRRLLRRRWRQLVAEARQ